MEFDDYEKLPCNSTTIHMVAGAFAGVMEHCVMFPVDSVKTRMQSLRPDPKAKYKNISEAFCKIIRYEGPLRPLRGMSVVVMGAGPAHALYFSCYEKMKRVFSGTEHGLHNPVAHGLAGSVSTLIHDAIMTPVDMVKQRMQIYNCPYKSCTNCMMCVWKAEGLRAFYRSYMTQLIMNIPFQSIHFMTYEYLQDLTNHSRTYDPKAHMISGAIAGAFAAAITTPLDVCKTLLNTQEVVISPSKHNRVNGLLTAIVTIYRFNGLRGYFQGLQARVIHQTPATAISWTVYEFFKFAIESKRDHTSISSKSLMLKSESRPVPVIA